MLTISQTVARFAGHRVTVAATFAIRIDLVHIRSSARSANRMVLLSNIIGTMTALFVLLVMQQSQNRDMAALQVKVDELIRSSEAGDHMIGIERLEADELLRLTVERQAGV